MVRDQQKGKQEGINEGDHEHEFEAIDDKTTRIVDRVTYQVPFGPIGYFADLLFVRRSVRKMFEQRREALKRLME